MTDVFNDITVIDASTVLAGPSVGMFFAELGAKVIKVEHPDYPDVTRSWKLPMEDQTSPISAYFSSINYKKQYHPLNLLEEGDHSAFLTLISDADVLITNFKKGDAEKFGIGDKALHALNHRLIIGKINGYGAESDRVAYDLILQAESGFMSINGTSNSGPIKMPVALIDVLAGHHLKEAILAALYRRKKMDKGCSLSVSLYEAAVSSLVNQASNYLMTGVIPERIGSLHPNIAPYGELFLTKDGLQITFAIGSDRHFERLCAILGLLHLPEDPRFHNNQSRVSHRNELFQLLQSAVQKYHAQELLKQLQSHHVPAGKIRSIDEVLKDSKSQHLIREETIQGEQTRRVTSVVFREH